MTKEERPTVRCSACQLFQYKTASGMCRRCRKPLPALKPPSLPLPTQPPEPESPPVPFSNQQEAVKNIGKRLAEIRLLKNFPQDSSKWGGSFPVRSYVSRLESGTNRPTIAVLEHLAERYGVSIREFFKTNDTGNPLFNDWFVREIAYLTHGKLWLLIEAVRLVLARKDHREMYIYSKQKVKQPRKRGNSFKAETKGGKEDVMELSSSRQSTESAGRSGEAIG